MRTIWKEIREKREREEDGIRKSVSDTMNITCDKY